MNLGSFWHSNTKWRAIPSIGEIIENDFGTQFKVLDVAGVAGNFEVLLIKMVSQVDYK